MAVASPTVLQPRPPVGQIPTAVRSAFTLRSTRILLLCCPPECCRFTRTPPAIAWWCWVCGCLRSTFAREAQRSQEALDPAAADGHVLTRSCELRGGESKHTPKCDPRWFDVSAWLSTTAGLLTAHSGRALREETGVSSASRVERATQSSLHLDIADVTRCCVFAQLEACVCPSVLRPPSRSRRCVSVAEESLFPCEWRSGAS